MGLISLAIHVGNWGGGSIWQITSGIFPSNAYVVQIDNATCFLVDPGLDPEGIDSHLIQLNLKPEYIFCTHGHFDHAGGAAYFQKKYEIKVFIHQSDQKTLKTSNFLLMVLKVDQRVTLPDVTYIQDGFSFDVNGYHLTYMPAPGHTPGSCVISFGNAWFTGDTIYSRGVGLSSMPGEDSDLLKRTILSFWDGLTEERMIYPGHGNVASGDLVRSQNKALLNFLGMV